MSRHTQKDYLYNEKGTVSDQSIGFYNSMLKNTLEEQKKRENIIFKTLGSLKSFLIMNILVFCVLGCIDHPIVQMACYLFLFCEGILLAILFI